VGKLEESRQVNEVALELRVGLELALDLLALLEEALSLVGIAPEVGTMKLFVERR